MCAFSRAQNTVYWRAELIGRDLRRPSARSVWFAPNAWEASAKASEIKPLFEHSGCRPRWMGHIRGSVAKQSWYGHPGCVSKACCGTSELRYAMPRIPLTGSSPAVFSQTAFRRLAKDSRTLRRSVRMRRSLFVCIRQRTQFWQRRECRWWRACPRTDED